jgi:cell division septation protein DedD
VTLEPAPAIVLAVASHIDASPLEELPVEETLPPAAMQVRAMVVASPAPPPSAPVTPEAASVRAQPANEIEAGGRPAPEHGPAYWVQLGAMSGMDTARSFWATLRTRHGGLLGPHQPSILGPDQFGGRLYHLRVGPLPSNAATDLCSGLQQAGGDCFRVAAASEPAGHAVQEGSAPALPRIGEAAQSRRSAVVPASSSH